MPKTSTLEDTLALQMRGLHIPTPEREYQFAAPYYGWRFDFAFPEARVAVEVEGITWEYGKSRHTTGEGYEEDCRKYSYAAIEGWCVIRVTGNMIESGDALDLIEAALKESEAAKKRIHLRHTLKLAKLRQKRARKKQERLVGN